MACMTFVPWRARTRDALAVFACAWLMATAILNAAEPGSKTYLRPAAIRPLGSEAAKPQPAKTKQPTLQLVGGEESPPIVGGRSNFAPVLQVPANDDQPGPAITTVTDDPPPQIVAPQQVEDFRVAQQPPRAAQPPMAQPPMADPMALPRMPVDLTHPFETIGETGELTLMVRRSKLMRTQVDIYRTAVVDASIVEVVQFTPREISLIGKSTGTTHVTFWFDQAGARPVTYLVRVEPDVERVKEIEDQYRLLEDVINEMYPNSKIELLVVADKLIVRGQAKDGEEAGQIISLVRSQSGGRQGGFGGGYGGGGGGGLGEGAAADVLSDSVTGSTTRSRLQVINMLRVPGVQQVALRVKIAELNRSAAKGFGVQVQGAINVGDSSKILLNSLVTAAGGGGPAIIGQVDGDDISIGIKYLQQSGVVRLLSEPTLVTMSGRSATFLAGGEFAVPTLVGGAGINAVTTDFRAYGAVISFLPTVLDKDRVRLQVSPEFSQIDAGTTVNGTPGLKTRSATTTVEMREGQTLAIAGLLSDSMTANKKGDLPFVSWLFGDRSVTTAESELIMLVTPELVQALDPEEVPPLPGFDVTEPTNAQFFLQGRLEGNPNYDYRSTVWPRLRKRYGAGGSAMVSGPFGHGQ